MSDNKREKDRRERKREGDSQRGRERRAQSLYKDALQKVRSLTSSVSTGLTDQACDSVRGDDTGYEFQEAGIRGDHLRGCFPPMGRWGREQKEEKSLP